MHWKSILKIDRNAGPRHEDIPSDLIREGIELWVDQNLSDRILGRAEAVNRTFFREFNEVTNGDINVQVTPEMVRNMRMSFRHIIMTDVASHLIDNGMRGWYIPENNALLVKRGSEVLAEVINAFDRDSLREIIGDEE